MSEILSLEEIGELNRGGRHCSQVVAGQWAGRLGLDEEMVIRMMAPFGGGAFHGELCGAVSGALAVIGTLYGAYELGDTEQDDILRAKAREFEARFEERFGSIVCRELLKDYDLDYAREGDRERGKETTAPTEVCHVCMRGALEILEEMIDQ